MALPRLQLFEFNDHARTPESLRDTVIETLSQVLDEAGVVRATIPVVESFLETAGYDAILDLCAGAGGPAEILCREMQAEGKRPPHILETDLFPRIEAWSAARERRPGSIDFVATPVDATNIPPEISAKRARVIWNAFHHFPPALGTAILRAAVTDRAPILILEGFERDPRGFLPFAASGVRVLYQNPLRSPKQRGQKMFWTWLTPIALAVSTWDGLVSTLRVYNERELFAMVAPFGAGYAWDYGTYEFPHGGRGMYFQGIPR
jgi:hypothetical protein